MHEQSFKNLKTYDKEINLFKEHTEIFYKLQSRIDFDESEEKIVSKYVNGLKWTIQDQLNLHHVIKIDEAYRMT